MLELDDIHFLYCGFNFYPQFIEPLFNALIPGGGFFLMKPVRGDDLTLRSWFTNYSLDERIEEINEMNRKMESLFDLNTEIVTYTWVFEPYLDKILAAMSVVCFGGNICNKPLLSIENYERGLSFLNKNIISNNLFLSQEVIIWRGRKR